MRISILLILLSTALMVSTSFTESTKALDSYQVFIIQDSIRKEVFFDAQEIQLKKKPFKIEVRLKDSLEGVSLSISYKRSYYDTPLSKHLPDWENIVGKTMAEDQFNKDRDLAVSDDALCYWYYTKGEVHRFDPSVKVENGMIIGTITVENICNTDINKTYSIKKITDPLYFVFFNYDYKMSYTHKKEDEYTAWKEYGRKRVKLSFN